MTDPLANCRECGSTDCGIYYTDKLGGWIAAYQCTHCEARAPQGHGDDQKAACAEARLRWQEMNAKQSTPTPTGEAK